ncbi:MAG TPA: hypothetical protein DD490_18195 [Acidobacteria bacterium]|nr:hypothetical protein [Acidobacteriota bacterium]
MQGRALVLVVALVGAGLIGCRAHEQETGTGPAQVAPAQVTGTGAWTVPTDVANAGNNPSQADYYDFAWQTFIALNWPAVAPSSTSNPGQPDTQQALGATASAGVFIPAVWQTYRDLGSTMLAGGADPGTWGSVPFEKVPAGCTPIPAGAVAPGFQPLVLDMVSKFDSANPDFIGQDDLNEASGNPLIDQSGWYVVFDVRLNQSEYTFIQQNGYYDAVNQINAFKAPNTGIQPFPRTGQESSFNPPLPSYAQFGALEVKTSWRVLDPAKDDLSRYYTQVGYFLQPDGTTCEGPATFGLVGLHILRLTPTTPSTWYWATFEQVDNTQVPSGSQLKPSFAAPGTVDGQCEAANLNQPPAAVSGNIPWNGTNTPVDVCRVFPISSAVQAANQKWQGQSPVQGTVWQYYQLIETINPSVQGGPAFSFPNNTTATVNTNAMANVTMETYSQGTTTAPDSCMTCHAGGQPLGAPQPLTSTNQIFTFVLENADSSDTTLQVKRPLPPAMRRSGR